MLKAIQLGQQLTKKEMKEVKGGLAAGSCCAHSDSGYVSCGISKETARQRADQYASDTGNQAFWCCASCAQQ
jgi:hypothetical protein